MEFESSKKAPLIRRQIFQGKYLKESKDSCDLWPSLVRSRSDILYLAVRESVAP